MIDQTAFIMVSIDNQFAVPAIRFQCKGHLIALLRPCSDHISRTGLLDGMDGLSEKIFMPHYFRSLISIYIYIFI
jgi:hypothetical protein